MANATFRKPVRFSEFRHRVVDEYRGILRDELQKAQDFAERLAGLMPGQDYIRHRNGAGVDEGITRPATLVLKLHDRIERIARRLASDTAPQPVTDHAKRQSQRENF